MQPFSDSVQREGEGRGSNRRAVERYKEALSAVNERSIDGIMAWMDARWNRMEDLTRSPIDNALHGRRKNNAVIAPR